MYTHTYVYIHIADAILEVFTSWTFRVVAWRHFGTFYLVQISGGGCWPPFRDGRGVRKNYPRRRVAPLVKVWSLMHCWSIFRRKLSRVAP